jgi:hypothetical protein
VDLPRLRISSWQVQTIVYPSLVPSNALSTSISLDFPELVEDEKNRVPVSISAAYIRGQHLAPELSNLLIWSLRDWTISY